jgi:Ca2+:H+ antiporter
MMTGLGFLLGGFKHIEQYFSAAVAQTISMLLLLAVVSLVIPTASHIMTNTTPGGILAQSRGTSVVILISYGLWVLFQLKTNQSMFREPAKPSLKRPSLKRKLEIEEGGAFRGIAQIGAATVAASGGGVNQEQLVRFSNAEAEDDEIHEPQLNLPTAIATLTVSTALIGFNTSFATDSIQGVLQHAGLSKTFLGLVILPILSVDPTSIFVAMQDKMDMSISLTLERCMQTCLMVVPLVVLLAWCMKIDTMTLEFDSFSITALFASIIIVTYVVQEGKSNW